MIRERDFHLTAGAILFIFEADQSRDDFDLLDEVWGAGSGLWPQEQAEAQQLNVAGRERGRDAGYAKHTGPSEKEEDIALAPPFDYGSIL